MSTKEQRDEWQRLSDAATALPWVKSPLWKDPSPIAIIERAKDRGLIHVGLSHADCTAQDLADRDFIAAAREAVPALLQDVAALISERNGAIEVADRQRSRAKDAEAELQRVKHERDAFQRALLDAWSEWSVTTITELPTESLAGVLRGVLRRAGDAMHERDAALARAERDETEIVETSQQAAKIARAEVRKLGAANERADKAEADADAAATRAAAAKIARSRHAGFSDSATRLGHDAPSYHELARCADVARNIAGEIEALPIGDAGRALLAEVARLRDENAALKTTLEAEQAGRNTEVLHLVEQLATAKSAIGRAHALIRLARSRFTGSQEGSERAECDAVLTGPECRAVAEYVGALEAEHEAVAELDEHEAMACLVDPPCGGCDACTARIAHAAVEALRTVKP